MSTKILRDTLKLADDGRVECTLAAPDGSVLAGVIEQAFFEEFKVAPGQKLSVARVTEIIETNFGYLENRADELWRQGNQQIKITY